MAAKLVIPAHSYHARWHRCERLRRTVCCRLRSEIAPSYSQAFLYADYHSASIASWNNAFNSRRWSPVAVWMITARFLPSL